MAAHGKRASFARSIADQTKKMRERRRLLDPDRESRIPRQTRSLLPSITLTSIFLLATSGVAGFYIMILILKLPNRRTTILNADQAFVMLSSLLSLLYVILHMVSAYRNEPVGLVRPPVLKLHALCFVIARLSLIGWAISAILLAVVIAKPKTCQRGTPLCDYHYVDITAAACAIITTGTLLTVLDYARYPFALPFVNAPKSAITSRVSAFDDDFFSRSRNNSSAQLMEKGNNSDHMSSKTSKPSIAKQSSQRSASSSVKKPVVPVLAKLKATEAGEMQKQRDYDRRLSMPGEFSTDALESTVLPTWSPITSLVGGISSSSIIAAPVLIPDAAPKRPPLVTSKTAPADCARASPVKTWGHEWQHLVCDSKAPVITAPTVSPFAITASRNSTAPRPHLKSLSTADSAISFNSSSPSSANPFSASPSTVITSPSAIFSPAGSSAADLISPASSVGGDSPLSPLSRQRSVAKAAAFAALSPTARPNPSIRSPLRTMSLAGASSTPSLYHARPRAPSAGRNWNSIGLPFGPSAMNQPSMRGSIVGGGTDGYSAYSAHLPGYFPEMGAGPGGSNVSFGAPFSHRRSVSMQTVRRSQSLVYAGKGNAAASLAAMQAHQRPRIGVPPPRLPLTVRPSPAPSSASSSSASTLDSSVSFPHSISSTSAAPRRAVSSRQSSTRSSSVALSHAPPLPPLPSSASIQGIVRDTARQQSVRKAQHSASNSRSNSTSKASSIDASRTSLSPLPKPCLSRKASALSRKERLHSEGKGTSTLRSKSVRRMRSLGSTASIAISTWSIASSSASKKRNSGEVKMSKATEYRGSMGERVEMHTQAWERGAEMLLREREGKENIGARTPEGWKERQSTISLPSVMPTEPVKDSARSSRISYEEDKLNLKNIWGIDFNTDYKLTSSIISKKFSILSKKFSIDVEREREKAIQAEKERVAREQQEDTERVQKRNGTEDKDDNCDEDALPESRQAGQDGVRERKKERALLKARRASEVAENASELMRKAGEKKRKSVGMMLGISLGGRKEQPPTPPQQQVDVQKEKDTCIGKEEVSVAAETVESEAEAEEKHSLEPFRPLSLAVTNWNLRFSMALSGPPLANEVASSETAVEMGILSKDAATISSTA